MTATALYRIFDSEGALLYIGISVDAFRRAKQHRKDKPWGDQIAIITVEHYGSRKEANAAERRAVHAEGPRYNLHFQADNYVISEELRKAVRAEVAGWPPLTASQLSLLVNAFTPALRTARQEERQRAELDAWKASQLAKAPRMDEATARRVSAALFGTHPLEESA